MHPSFLIQNWLETHSTFKTLAFVSLYGGKLTRLVILIIVYIPRNSHQKAMSEVFVRKLVVANQRSQRWFSLVKKKKIRPIRIHRGV